MRRSLYLISLIYIAEIHIYIYTHTHQRPDLWVHQRRTLQAAGPPHHLGVNTRLSGGGLLRHQMAVCLTWTIIDFEPSCHI